jgi:hypothetical protein
MMMPGSGIIVCRDDVVIMSGPSNVRDYKVDISNNLITLSGYDDNIWLKRRNVSPIPADTSPPYSTQEFDTHTGVGSTILRQYVNLNLGPGAVTARKLAGLSLGTDPVVGASVTGNGRWDNLLTFLQTLAITAGVWFRIIQTGVSALQFQVYSPIDRTDTVKFSIDLGNLTAFEYSSTAPTGNYFFVGGDGDGTARAINEFSDSTSVAEWGRVEGDFVNSSGSSGSAQMSQDGSAALASGTEQTSLSITPTDTPQCLYGVHYALGDTVTIQLSQPIRTPYGQAGRIVDQIQSVDVHITAENGAVTTPTIASAPASQIKQLFTSFRDIKRRLNLLERT